MLQLLGQKYAKHVAFLLVSIFYVDFLGQLHAALINARRGLPIRYATDLHVNPGPLNRETEAIDHVAKNEKIPAAGTAVVAKKKRYAPRIGPTQPESSSFQSASTDNMVDLFSGGFSYNIPLLDVGGYPVSIHYNSGITMDQEASWVGLGWNVNPGAVSRTMRGLPDDFNGQDMITKTESIK